MSWQQLPGREVTGRELLSHPACAICRRARWPGMAQPTSHQSHLSRLASASR